MADYEDVDHEKLPQRLTADELATWIPAKQALERMIACGPSHGEATEALWKLLVTGHLRSGAEHHTVEIPRLENGNAIEIEDMRWRSFGQPWQSALWSTGQVSLSIESEGTGYRRPPASFVTYFGVRFEPVALGKTLAGLGECPSAESSTPAPAAPSAVNKGGRRPAWWREPVLVEIAGQIHDGDLKPKKLADIENAMNEWLGKKGEYPGERTVRNVARLLWSRFYEEGKNLKE
jgi:hypothetical protein